MKKYLIGLLIASAAGVALFLLFSQGLFPASDGIIETVDDAIDVGADIVEPVEEEDAGAEEEVLVYSIDEEASGEDSEPEGGKQGNASDDTEFAITDFPFQDFIQAREKGEPIVLKFYSET
jgi:hypothetical protein